MRLLPTLRITCLIEAISQLALFFIAMPLKYAAGMPKAVSIVGALHGGLFLLVLVLLVIAFSGEYLKPKLAGLVFLGAIIPFVAFFVDGKLKAVAQEK